METVFTIDFLQQYWWFIVALVGGILIFLLFVQGGQMMLLVTSNEKERDIIANVFGRKWEITFTTLVLFGGAIFAAFPLFYATSFGGAYWVWMAILLGFVLQAIAFEFRSKPHNLLGKKVYDGFLIFNGILSPFLIGTALGTMFSGNLFTVQKTNLLQTGASNFNITQWETTTHGLEALTDWSNLFLGLAGTLIALIMGALYVIQVLDHKEIVVRAQQIVRNVCWPFFIAFVLFMVKWMNMPGYQYDSETNIIQTVPHLYITNMLSSPLMWGPETLGMISVILGIALTIFTDFRHGFWIAGFGIVLSCTTLMLSIGLHNTAFYPSTFDPQSSLTIVNSSSSLFTLKVMAFVSLLVPVVIAYIAWAWRKMDKNRYNEIMIEESDHKY